MYKLVVLLSLATLAIARPGYVHNIPVAISHQSRIDVHSHPVVTSLVDDSIHLDTFALDDVYHHDGILDGSEFDGLYDEIGDGLEEIHDGIIGGIDGTEEEIHGHNEVVIPDVHSLVEEKISVSSQSLDQVHGAPSFTGHTEDVVDVHPEAFSDVHSHIHLSPEVVVSHGLEDVHSDVLSEVHPHIHLSPEAVSHGLEEIHNIPLVLSESIENFHHEEPLIASVESLGAIEDLKVVHAAPLVQSVVFDDKDDIHHDIPEVHAIEIAAPLVEAVDGTFFGDDLHGLDGGAVLSDAHDLVGAVVQTVPVAVSHTARHDVHKTTSLIANPILHH